MRLSDQINLMYADPGRDDAAFWGLVRRYIHNTARLFVRDPDLAEDATQQAVLDAVRYVWSGATSPHPLTKLLFTMARCHAYQEWTRDRVRRECVEDIEGFTPAGDDTHITLARESDAAHASEALDEIRTTIKPRDYALFDLLRSGVPMTQAAHLLGLNHRTGSYRASTWVDAPGHQSFRALSYAEPIRRYPLPSSAASLRPGPVLMEAAAEGNKPAQALIDEWRPKPRVLVVDADEYDQLTRNNYGVVDFAPMEN